MQPTNTRLHSFVHALQAVYSKWLYSMLSIATVAMAMVLLQEERIIDATDVLKIIQGLVAASSVAGLLGGYRRYQSAISSLRTAWTADEKERRYRRALTSWWATNALPGILSLTGFCLTGQYALFLLGLFHTAIHFMFAPRLPVIEMLLHVSGSEREPARQGALNEITDQ